MRSTFRSIYQLANLEDEWQGLQSLALRAQTDEELEILRDYCVTRENLPNNEWRKARMIQKIDSFYKCHNVWAANARNLANALDCASVYAFHVAKKKHKEQKNQKKQLSKQLREAEKLKAGSDSDSCCGKSFNEKTSV